MNCQLNALFIAQQQSSSSTQQNELEAEKVKFQAQSEDYERFLDEKKAELDAQFEQQVENQRNFIAERTLFKQDQDAFALRQQQSSGTQHNTLEADKVEFQARREDYERILGQRKAELDAQFEQQVENQRNFSAERTLLRQDQDAFALHQQQSSINQKNALKAEQTNFMAQRSRVQTELKQEESKLEERKIQLDVQYRLQMEDHEILCNMRTELDAQRRTNRQESEKMKSQILTQNNEKQRLQV